MPAIAVKSTATTDSAWDGPAAEARLKNDGDSSYYKAEYAWYDAGADDSKKAAYKFPHHMVSGDGAVGAANVKACQSIVAVLNGGMGGAKIPEGDRSGVYAHASRHLKDAGQTPAELKSEGDYLVALAESRVMEMRERRTFTGLIEVREGYRSDPVIKGHAAVFNQNADLGYFTERVAPGTFSRAIKEDDVRALWNHDDNHVLGRSRPGRDDNTLSMSEDSKGLAVTITPPDTQMSRDLIQSMKRGDVDQMSFGFSVRGQKIEKTEDGNILRTITDVKLYDVSPVTFPAYTGTDVAVRSIAQRIEEEYRRLKEGEGAFVPDDLWERELEQRALEVQLEQARYLGK